MTKFYVDTMIKKVTAVSSESQRSVKISHYVGKCQNYDRATMNSEEGCEDLPC